MLFSIDSVRLGNVDTSKAQSARNTAHTATSWRQLDGPILDVMARFNTEKASVIESSGRKDSAPLGARHTNT